MARASHLLVLVLLHATTALGMMHPAWSCTRASRVHMMAKGDGKKSRPKQPPKPPPAATAPPSPPPPQASRVKTDSLVSVRKQIALVKAFDKMSKSPSKPAARTSFRRKREESGNASRAEEEIIDINLDVSLPTLLVDGYNVIGAWPRLKKRFQKGDLQTARDLLLEDVADYAIRRYNVTVVFDANGATDNMRKDRIDEYAGGLVTVVYAHESADAYIEGEARALGADGKTVTVASSDNNVGTACSVHGANVVSAPWLVAELKASRKASALVVDEFNKQQARKHARGPNALWSALDPSLREAFDSAIDTSSNAALSRKQREAAESIRTAIANGELTDRGAAARRRQLLVDKIRNRRSSDRGADADEAEGSSSNNSTKSS